MCIISEVVEDVSSTNILVSKCGTQQLTVYSNRVSTLGDNLMILPVPADSVEFLDFTECKSMFKTLKSMFEPQMRGAKGLGMGYSANSLTVHKVGSYFASFAKNLEDLERVDKTTFGTVNKGVLEVIKKHYKPNAIIKNFGFIVCKLNKGIEYEYHPFAYKHKLFYDNTLFIPTRHVHVHALDATGSMPGSEKKKNPVLYWIGSKLVNESGSEMDKPQDEWDHNIYVYNSKKITTMNGASDIEKRASHRVIFDIYNSAAKKTRDQIEHAYISELPKLTTPTDDVKTVSKIEIVGNYVNDDILVTV